MLHPAPERGSLGPSGEGSRASGVPVRGGWPKRKADPEEQGPPYAEGAYRACRHRPSRRGRLAAGGWRATRCAATQLGCSTGRTHARHCVLEMLRGLANRTFCQSREACDETGSAALQADMHLVTVVALAGPPLGSSLQLRPRSEMPVPLTLARSCVASTIAGKPHIARRGSQEGGLS